jgi:acetoin utilization deacetylase AcuC-like enzyme
VLIIDWDVHHGNGTQEIFWTDPTVFLLFHASISVLSRHRLPDERGGGKGEGFTLNVPLARRTSAGDHRQAFTDALHEIEGRFPPDLIIISAGFDSRRGDPSGNSCWTTPISLK